MTGKHTWHGYTFEENPEEEHPHNGAVLPAAWIVQRDNRWVGYFPTDLESARKEVIKLAAAEALALQRRIEAMTLDLHPDQHTAA